jgi:hypothetical protein
MSGLGSEDVRQTPLEPGLGGQICLDFPGKLDWELDFDDLQFANSLNASHLIVQSS